MRRVYVVILGFCRLWAAAQGLVGLATVWIAVWWSQKYSASYLSLFDYSLHGEDQRRDVKFRKYCGGGLLGYGDDEL